MAIAQARRRTPCALVTGHATTVKSACAALILLGIDIEPTTVDTIAERTTLPVHLILQELTFLSLKGAIRRVDGQSFARRQSK